MPPNGLLEGLTVFSENTGAGSGPDTGAGVGVELWAGNCNGRAIF